MNVNGELSRGISIREEGEKRILWVKRFEVCFMYTHEDSIMKPTKYFRKRGRRGGNGNIMEGVNLYT
jgi:hypothetical protein